MKKSKNYKLKKLKNSKPYIKMDKKVIKFNDTQIKKYKSHQNESPIWIKDIDIKKIVISNKFSFGKQDFI